VLADSSLTSAVMFGIGGLLVGEAVLGSLRFEMQGHVRQLEYR